MAADGPANEPVVVGRIAGAYGVLGWVRVVSFTEPPENLVDYRPWLIGKGLIGKGLADADWQPVNPVACRPHGAGFVVQLRELASREQAQALTGRLIAVPRSALPSLDAEGEYYWRDLVGLTVRDPDGRRIGRVDHLIATGAHDVLVIDTDGADDAASTKSGGAQLLVPFLRRFVPEVDLARGMLVIDWQEPV
jgi:16S rRNA processing protein RimM